MLHVPCYWVERCGIEYNYWQLTPSDVHDEFKPLSGFLLAGVCLNLKTNAINQ